MQVLDNGYPTKSVEDVTQRAFQKLQNVSKLTPVYTAHGLSATKAKEMKALAYLDSIVLLLACFLFLATSNAQRRIAEDAARDTITIADYTVAISNLPLDATTQEVLYPVEFFSKLNYFIFGYFDPKIFFFIIKINIFWGDLSGISAKTATLIIASATSGQCFCLQNEIIYFLDTLIQKTFYKMM